MPTRATPTTLLDKRIPDHDMRLQQAKQSRTPPIFRWLLRTCYTQFEYESRVSRQVITVPERIAMETTAVECDIMRQSRRCNESPMMKSENKWIFNQEPEDFGYWLRTTTVVTVNCMLEEVVLSRIDEGDMINTPLGKTNVSHGSLSHNHLTLFWIDTYGKPTDIVIRQLEKGVGFWYESSTNGTWILQDDSKQLDFHVRLTSRCQTVKCDKKIDSWTVIGDNHLFIIKYPLGPSAATVPSIIKDIVTKRNDPLDINIRQNARIQYLEDAAIRHENELIRVIQSMQCDQRRAKHAQAVSTAQYNGWMAAAQLGLRQCIKLIATGNIVSALQCTPTTVNFTTDTTTCGPQPRFNNFTIGRSGWELTAFTPCYWAGGIMNFNDKSHAYRNNTWQPVEASVVIPQRDLADAFRYQDVNFFEYQHQTNPAYTEALISPMDIMADITASMNEHSLTVPNQITGTSAIVVSAAEKAGLGTFTNWFENFKVYSFIILLIAIFLLIARACYALGFCGLIWKCCCKPPRPPPTAVYQTRSSRPTGP
ncbi:hypothetical protein OUZ56_026617 [Daphnia magna]|uniref:Uncharacterized protein n=1 Tax=Daphnia magna TaxID=35525 RepID=A0ABQ9ZMH1_9CRUS|nr:hypothetical protein OUZ56_026617 [Daphnia magna]